MGDVDVVALRKAAEGATPGRWTVPGDGDEYVGPWDVVTQGVPGERYIICEHAGQDAAYIAAADPTTILALLDRLEMVEREREELLVGVSGALARLDAVREALTTPTSAEGEYRRGVEDAFEIVAEAIR